MTRSYGLAPTTVPILVRPRPGGPVALWPRGPVALWPCGPKICTRAAAAQTGENHGSFPLGPTFIATTTTAKAATTVAVPSERQHHQT